MARIQCGSCGGVHTSAAEVRACHQGRQAALDFEAPAAPALDFEEPPGAPSLAPEQSAAPALPPQQSAAPAVVPQKSAVPAVAPKKSAVPAPAPVAVGAPPAAGETRRSEQWAGPDRLGRNLVVAPGGSAPPPWADALWVDVSGAARDPAGLIAALWPRWHARQRIVFELPPDSPLADPDRPPPGRPPAGPIWDVPADHLVDDEVLHHLLWANSVDGRQPERARWRWADAALTAGARPAPPHSEGGEVVLPDGTEVWCDGGPPKCFDPPALHRISLERGRLEPLGPARSGPAAAELDLAPDQRAAVTHAGGTARIIAPAGSGKTRVLTERARLLLGAWRAPADATCLVAFNKRAADEMLERTPDLRGLQVRTLNALGLAILDGRPPFRPRTDRRHSTVDERQVRRLLDELIALPRARRRTNTDPLAPWLEALSTVRLGLRSPAEVEDELEGDVEGLPEVVERYRAALARRHELDFDEQVVRAIEVLLAEPDTRHAAQRACRLLLVDEFQDLTPAHLLLVRLLASPDLAVFGVGDDDQTIYGYTGATPEWLIGYERLFPGAGDHPLEVNYRCPPAVVAAADKLLTHNGRRVAKVIRPRPGRPPDGDGLVVREGGEDATEVSVDTVTAALAEGARPGEIAVLTRVNASLAPVQVALLHARVPVRPAVDERWLERTGVRAALGWLRLATNPGAWRAADVADTARRPGRGLSVKVVEWMAEQRSPEGLDRLASRLQRERDADKVAGYAADVRLLAGLTERSTTADVLRAVRDRIGLDEAMDLLDSSQRSRGGSAQGDDLDALVALARLHPVPATFGAWLRQQLSGGGRRSADGDLVLLSTVHAVKGREWPHVIVHEASSGLFPHRLTDDVEEERRVFHVAITRASQRATVVTGAVPSPFVAEMLGRVPSAPARPSTVELRSRSRERRAVPAGAPAAGAPASPKLLDALKAWRRERSRRDGVPAFVVFPDATLDLIAGTAPRTLVALSRLHGIGPTKLDRYGDEVLAVVEEAGPSASPPTTGG